MIHYLVKHRRLRPHVAGGRLRFTMDEGEAFSSPQVARRRADSLRSGASYTSHRSPPGSSSAA